LYVFFSFLVLWIYVFVLESTRESGDVIGRLPCLWYASPSFFPQGLHGVTCVPCSLGSCFVYIIDGWDPVYQVARFIISLPKCACYTRRELFCTLMLPLSMVWKLAL